MGEVVSEVGFSPDPDKISAIHNMSTPSSKQDLQRLSGMINYLAKYIPNMFELTLHCDPYLSLMCHGLGFQSTIQLLLNSNRS